MQRDRYPVVLGGLAKAGAYMAGMAATAALAVGIVHDLAGTVIHHTHATASASIAAVPASAAAKPVVEHRVLQEDWFRSFSSTRSRSATITNIPPPRLDRGQRSNLIRPADPPPSAFGFFDWGDNGRRDWIDPLPEAPRQASRTFRTVCVRLCDGFYFPISFAATSDRFARDESTCQSSCGSEAKLYVYRNPGEEPQQMVDLRGQPYARLRTAFLYRTTYDESCKCKPHAWEQVSLDRHRLYALEARLKKGDRTVRQELDAIRQRQRQTALEQRSPRKQSENRRAGQRVAVVPPPSPVASDVAPALAAVPEPGPEATLAPAPRVTALLHDASNAPESATSAGLPPLAGTKSAPPGKTKQKRAQSAANRQATAGASARASSGLSWNQVFGR